MVQTIYYLIKILFSGVGDLLITSFLCPLVIEFIGAVLFAGLLSWIIDRRNKSESRSLSNSHLSILKKRFLIAVRVTEKVKLGIISEEQYKRSWLSASNINNVYDLIRESWEEIISIYRTIPSNKFVEMLIAYRLKYEESFLDLDNMLKEILYPLKHDNRINQRTTASDRILKERILEIFITKGEPISVYKDKTTINGADVGLNIYYQNKSLFDDEFAKIEKIKTELKDIIKEILSTIK